MSHPGRSPKPPIPVTATGHVSFSLSDGLPPGCEVPGSAVRQPAVPQAPVLTSSNILWSSGSFCIGFCRIPLVSKSSGFLVGAFSVRADIALDLTVTMGLFRCLPFFEFPDPALVAQRACAAALQIAGLICRRLGGRRLDRRCNPLRRILVGL
jgi:hypothetical protein